MIIQKIPRLTRQQKKQRNQRLIEQNANLKNKLHQINTRYQSLSHKLDTDIKRFEKDSTSSLNQLNQHMEKQKVDTNRSLHQLTLKYQSLLQKQITLLTQNQKLAQSKQTAQAQFNNKVDKISSGYQQKIGRFQNQVKENMRKIGQIQGVGLINRLIQNKRFKNEIRKLGGNVENIKKQTVIQKLTNQIKQKDEQIKILEQNNSKIDEQVQKMNDMMDTFKKLLQNMVNEKDNLLKQNMALSDKLIKSKELMGKFLPNGL